MSEPEDLATVEVVADSLGEYLQAWWTRIKGGDSGVLPILAGLAIIIVIFQVQEPVFLSAGNIVNLLTRPRSSCCSGWPRSSRSC